MANSRGSRAAAPDFSLEQPIWERGLLAAGLDEAGRGAWFGPVSAGAVILPPDPERLLPLLKGVRDSKQMTPAQRVAAAGRIRAAALAWGVGFAAAAEIDALGIVAATRLSMRRALAQCAGQAGHLLIDALRLPGVDLPQTSLFFGDSRSVSIAAASILAKTARDALLVELDALYPGYGLARHKGYGVPAHREAIDRLGPCALHRRSFKPFHATLDFAEA